MSIIHKARGSEIQRHQQRLFLCNHPKDVAARDILLKDLLSHDAGVDCIVSYVESADESLSIAELEAELRETQLMVLIVSRDFLDMPKMEQPITYAIARKINMPILPVALDTEILPQFTRQEGAIHSIAITDSEYRTKLRSQLENYIISDDLINEIIDKAFTARLFLSYRKKDVAFAHALMKNFHSIPGFEAISIWYDSFLTAGRVFDKEIKESIDIADLFLLLVTQNITEAGNYVLTEEYPYAINRKKNIIAVEMQMPDASFHQLYKSIGIYTKLDELSAAFIKALPAEAIQTDKDSERLYLLGMAYLRGVTVERDYDRAISLLTDSAEQNNLRAARRLGAVSFEKTAYHEATQWYRTAANISETTFGKPHIETVPIYEDIAFVYLTQGEYRLALEWYQKALAVYESINDASSAAAAMTYNNIGLAQHNLGDCENALAMHIKAMAICEKLLEPTHPQLAAIYNSIASAYNNLGEYTKALDAHEKALSIREKVFGTENPLTAQTYNNIGIIYRNQGRHDDALAMFAKDLSVSEKLLGTNHPDTGITYNNIAVVYNAMRNYSKALEMHMKNLHIKEKLFGSDNPATAMAYNNIGVVHYRMGNLDASLDYLLRAFRVREKTLGETHPLTEQTYTDLRGVYELSGRPKSFEMWLSKPQSESDNKTPETALPIRKVKDAAKGFISGMIFEPLDVFTCGVGLYAAMSQAGHIETEQIIVFEIINLGNRKLGKGLEDYCFISTPDMMADLKYKQRKKAGQCDAGKLASMDLYDARTLDEIEALLGCPITKHPQAMSALYVHIRPGHASETSSDKPSFFKRLFGHGK